jgi:hypothetical protein
MSVAPVTVPARCPRCGAPFWATHAPTSSEVGWAFCPRCQQPTPSLPPRESPPLFTWEVYRRFYPEPSWPRSPSVSLRRILFALVVVAGVALLATSGAFAYFGGIGLSPSRQTVAGTVEAASLSNQTLVPMSEVPVTITNMTGGSSATVMTDGSGDFSFAAVPPGEHQLTAQAYGYRLSQMSIFLAPAFSSPQGNVSSLEMTLVPGNLSAPYEQAFAPYPDLETYLSYLFSASAIELVGGLVALWGGWSLWVRRSAVRGVVGTAAGFLTPFLATVAGYQTLFLLVAPATIVLAAIAIVLGGSDLLLVLTSQRPLDGIDLSARRPPGEKR